MRCRGRGVGAVWRLAVSAVLPNTIAARLSPSSSKVANSDRLPCGGRWRSGSGPPLAARSVKCRRVYIPIVNL